MWIGQSKSVFKTKSPKSKLSFFKFIIFSGLGLRGCVSKAEINKFEGEESMGDFTIGLSKRRPHTESINVSYFAEVAQLIHFLRKI